MRLQLIAVFAGLMAHMNLAFAQPPSPTPPPGPDWDMVAFEMKSWGEPISSWSLGSDGGGSWTETVKAEGAQLGKYDLVWHEIEPQIQNYIELERLLRSLPIDTPDSNSCDNFMTDMPYGTLRLTRGPVTTEIAWNSGCMDERYQALLTPLRAANEKVEAWGKASPATRTESHGSDE